MSDWGDVKMHKCAKFFLFFFLIFLVVEGNEWACIIYTFVHVLACMKSHWLDRTGNHIDWLRKLFVINKKGEREEWSYVADSVWVQCTLSLHNFSLDAFGSRTLGFSFKVLDFLSHWSLCLSLYLSIAFSSIIIKIKRNSETQKNPQAKSAFISVP